MSNAVPILKCYCCGDTEHEVDLKTCENCGVSFCDECGPYRVDDAPIDLCLECCEACERPEGGALGKPITAEWLESLHPEKKWKSHGLRRYWFTGRDQCSLTVLETRDEWYLELTGATKAVTQNQLLDLLRALKGGAS